MSVDEETLVGRRVVLGRIGLGAVGVLVGRSVQGWLQRTTAPITAVDPTGLSQLLPVAGGFRLYTITDSFPGTNVATWRLKVTGMVDRPLSLSLDDLKAMSPTSVVKDFQCVTGRRVQGVHWTGVPL